MRFPWHTQGEERGTGAPDFKKATSELVLEGGAAFGTGDHPTTRLCCRWLQAELASNKVRVCALVRWSRILARLRFTYTVLFSRLVHVSFARFLFPALVFSSFPRTLFRSRLLSLAL